MAERQLISIPFGIGGIDRVSATAFVRPGSHRDLRNFIAHNGRLLVRPGHLETTTFVDDEENPVIVIGGIAVTSEATGLIVGYRQETGKVFVYRVTAEGATPTMLTPSGRTYLWQLTAGSDIPTIQLAEVGGQIFIAHDEPALGRRQTTYYYDPLSAVALRPLRADLDGAGEDDVKFRGVWSFGAYLLGSGFAAPGDPGHEVFRWSRPWIPTSFLEQNALEAGEVNRPILHMRQTPAGGLVIYKETNVWRLVGNTPRDWGVRLVDPDFGLAGSRLVADWRGGHVYWSPEGPRWTNGGQASENVGEQLNLQGYEPFDLNLVERGDTSKGFAFHDPTQRLVEFVFARLAYVMMYDAAGNIEWSNSERAFTPHCAFALYNPDTEQGGTDRPVGYPSFIDSAEWTRLTDFDALVRIGHNGATGNEVVEIWLKPDAGTWSLHAQAAVLVQPFQDVGITNLVPGTDYEIAYRYRAGGLFTVGYTGATPDDWTAATAADSKGTFSTPATARRTLDYTWRRDASDEEYVNITFDSGPATSTDLLKSTTIDGAYTLVGNVDEFEDSIDYAPEMGEEETYLFFKTQSRDEFDTLGALSNPLRVWIGPRRPFGYPNGASSQSQSGSVTFIGETERGAKPAAYAWPAEEWDEETQTPVGSESTADLYVGWQHSGDEGGGSEDFSTELWANVDEGGWNLLATVPFADPPVWYDQVPRGSSIQLRTRTKSEAFSVEDFSDYSSILSLVAP